MTLFHSQFGEDLWLAQNAKLPERGVYVDVGACHATELSNTAWLERLGWDGLCIDADPRCVELLKSRRRVVQAAVSDTEAEVEFRLSPNIGFSGLQSETGNGSIRLRTERLETILAREGIGEVDLLSVDTEGTELDVLKSLGTVRPHYLIVEHVTCGRNHRDELLRHLDADYCLLHETQCNLILRRRKDAEQAVLAMLPTAETIGKLFSEHARPIHQSVAAVQSIPRYGTNSHVDCLFAMTYTLGIKADRQQGVFWDQCLTTAIENAIKAGYEFVLTIDHDTVFTPDDVAELWRLMKANPAIDALCGCQVARERDQPLMMHTDATGELWQPVTPEELQAETVKLKTAHFGLTLLRCPSFAKLRKPWFLAIPNAGGSWGEGHIDSDIAFWANWWDSENTLHQANHVVLGHAQEIISWPGEDLKPVHQYLGDYRINGRAKSSLNYKEKTDERS